MLTLTRREGEKVYISSDIVITVVRIVGTNKVRIGIEAPKEVPIVREELIEHKERPCE